MIIGLLLLVVALTAQLAVLLGARWLVAVAAGTPGAWVPFRAFDEPPSGTPRWARPAMAVASVLAMYTTGAICLTAAYKTAGSTEFDTTVDVRAGGPAELAGLRSGDRILRVGDQPVSRFDEISTSVQAQGRTGPVVITFARGGAESAVTVTPTAGAGGQPKIGVTARGSRPVSVDLGTAAMRAMSAPAELAYAVLTMLRGDPGGRVELMGPAAVVSATAASPGATALFVLGFALTETCMFLTPLSLVFALFGFRARAGRAS